MKKALVLNISYNDIDIIKNLKKLGFYVYATGMYDGLPGQIYADTYIKEDYSNQEVILEMAKNLNIDSICSCCNDAGVTTAAYVAEKLGLQGHDTYKNAITIQHKDKFNKLLNNLNIQKSYSINFSDKNTAIKSINEISYPAIIKPTDLCGGTGISKAKNEKEAILSIEKAFNLSKNKNIVIEKFIDGKQYGLCTFLVNQKVSIFCSNNEFSFINPYRVEVDLFPSDCEESIISDLITKIEKIASNLKLKDGIFHIQFIVNNGKAYIIEAMRRVLGNLYTNLAAKLTNFDWVYFETKSHCGIDCSSEIKKQINNIKPTKKYYAYRSVVGHKNGKLKELIIPSEAEKHIFKKYKFYTENQEITHYKTEQLALLFFEFNTREEMNKTMVENYDKIYIKYNE